MPKNPNVAFIGKAGAGKTTAADLLVEFLGYTRVSFAAKLKDVAAELWGHNARKDRNKLQKLGVAVRDIEEDTWVHLLLASIIPFQPVLRGRERGGGYDENHGPFVVDDCRFPNEYWALQGEGWVIIRVTADKQRRVTRLQANGKLQDLSQLDHESETALDHIEPAYTVENNGTQQELMDKLTPILNMELKRT